MRNATLITYNSAGVIQNAMIWHDETDEDERVQLSIGDYKYLFNNIGELQSSTGTISCATNMIASTCAKRNDITIIPTEFKTE